MLLRSSTLPSCSDSASAVRTLQSHAAALPDHVDAATLVRLEVPLDMTIDVQTVLGWLAEKPAKARSFWADRHDSLLLAGLGEAWHVGGLGWTLDQGVAALEGTLASASSRLRMLGGVCFHGELRSSGPWKAFGAWRFALPQLELGRDANGAWLALHVHGTASDWAERKADALALLSAEPTSLQRQHAEPTVLAVVDQPDRAGWRDGVERALDAMADGDLDKVVLARKRTVELAEKPDALRLLRQLAEREPKSFRFCLQPRGDSAFVGASPERLLKMAAGDVVSEALAGTRARGATPEIDAAASAELQNSDKDRREHALVVQMVTDTLGRVCQTVDAPAEPNIMALSHVQHLHTPIWGQMGGAHGLADVLGALHPTPAVGGTPSRQAQTLIEKLEPFQRGLYAAPVGWIGGGRQAEFTVAIRSALIEDKQLSLFSGAGLVRGSEPDVEWGEIDAKIAALWQAFGLEGTTS
ncbi:MAG: isochorismate synthase [Myxococcales bacterium]|nr:isochorismate synthase [Myxococcales bacterium]